MNINLLIDAVVRQTTVLIAHLATATGTRAPLAHVANQIFLDLVQELRRQGLGRKVIADMFGMALRTYHGRVQRLSVSPRARGAPLSPWWAIPSPTPPTSSAIPPHEDARCGVKDHSPLWGPPHAVALCNGATD